jgi:tripartite-type tricarboxylate transporter receptor subunit TctC
MLRRHLVAATLLAATLALFLSSSAFAQPHPDKPVTLIVPWPAGGSTDRHLRTLAEIAAKNLGQNIIVENKPGGGGTTGPGRAQGARARSTTARPASAPRRTC